MARLMRLFAERLGPDDPLGEYLLSWPGDPAPVADGLPLRLAGALHALCQRGIALVDVYPPSHASDDILWSAVTDTMAAHSQHIRTWLRSSPQTNEVRRSAIILPALAMLREQFDRPVALYELGASAGLNLRADQFYLKTDAGTLGPSSSPVLLTPDWQGTVPEGELPKVVSRQGVDLNPLNPATKNDQDRLLAYLWADQPDRIDCTKSAIELAARFPASVDQGDAGAWLAEKLPISPPKTLRLIFHTIAWQYFPKSTVDLANSAIAKAAEDASSDHPLAHLAMESDGGEGAAVTLAAWPGGKKQLVARVDFHGRWVNWLV